MRTFFFTTKDVFLHWLFERVRVRKMDGRKKKERKKKGRGESLCSFFFLPSVVVVYVVDR